MRRHSQTTATKCKTCVCVTGRSEAGAGSRCKFSNCVDCFVEWQAKQDVYFGQVFEATSVCWLFESKAVRDDVHKHTCYLPPPPSPQGTECVHTHFEKPYDSVRQCSAIVENTENRLAPSTRTILWNDRVQARVLYWINMFIVKNRRANGCERGGAGDNEKLNQSFNWVETFTNARRTRTHCHKYLIDLSILLDEFYGNFSMLPKTSGNDVPLCVGGFQTDTRMRPKSLRSLLTLLSDDFSRPPLSF